MRASGSPSSEGAGRAALVSAFVAAAALAAMLFASRLPPGGEFFLPRRGGYWLYRAAWALFSRAGGRLSFSLATTALLLACAGVLMLALRRAVKKPPKTWSAWTGLALGPLAALLLAGRLGARALDLVQLLWFPYGSMDAREPLAAALLFAAAFAPAAAAAVAWAAGRRRKALALFGALVAMDAAGALFGAVHGVGRPLGVPAATGKTLFVVMIEGPKGPGHESYAIAPDVFGDPDPRERYRVLAEGPRDGRTLRALRALYTEETKRWDLDGLRSALLLGAVKGDPLAPGLLLAHLTAVAPSPAALSALGALADEDAWRVGALGAAAVARAYGHLGDREAAARWARKASGSGGVAPGLIAVSGGGSLRPGRISGTLAAPGRSRVALYERQDPGAPYFLDAAGLVASAAPDARGRFSFTGLAAGRYYLAVALSNGDGRRGEVSVSGNQGDVILDARRPSRDLPPLVVGLIPR